MRSCVGRFHCLQGLAGHHHVKLATTLSAHPAYEAFGDNVTHLPSGVGNIPKNTAGNLEGETQNRLSKSSSDSGFVELSFLDSPLLPPSHCFCSKGASLEALPCLGR